MIPKMTQKYIKVETIEPGIKIIKISRPEVLNALNTAVLQEMKALLEREAENPHCRVIILTGDGEKAFVAGADISEMQNKSISTGVEFAQIGHSTMKFLELMPKPTLAAVNGYALGGGMEIALSCDFIIASDQALFGQPEVGLGVIPGFGGTIRLSKFVGLPRAKELIYSGRKITAKEAFSIGLVNHVFPAHELMQKVIEIAKTISQQSHAAVVCAKQLLNEFSESYGLNFKLDAETQAFGRLFGTHDQKEGMKAFLEKRKPQFQ
jgi:enoyl-CoA hydratase